MGNSTSIKLLLPTGEPEGLRIAEIPINWTGKAIAAPRTEIKHLLAYPELKSYGVYLLLGNAQIDEKCPLYIGEAADVGKRVRNHHQNKDFWTQVIVFVNPDANLTRSHFQYLEGRLIGEAKKVGRYKLTNDQPSGANLSEGDRQGMEAYLWRIKQILPSLGCDALVPIVKDASDTKQFICKIKDLVAYGQRSAEGFVILKDSEAVKEVRPCAPTQAAWVIKLRDRLIKEGILVLKKDRYVFSKNYEFASPSAAAGAVRGGSAAGPLNWRTADGKTLKEIDAAT